MTFRLALLITGCVAAALAGSDKMAKDLDSVLPGSNVSVIVQYNHAPGQADFDELTSKGGSSARALRSVNGIAVHLPAARLAALAGSTDIDYITPDRQVRRSMDHTRPTVGADLAASYGYSGKGISVAVIDSGIADHGDLRDALTGNSRIVYHESFVAPPELDRYGHGTHVAGILAGTGKGSAGAYRGIAPGTLLVDLQALDENGVGTDSSVVRALERAIELKEQLGIRVVNLSLGRPVVESYQRDPICRAVEAAWKAGLVVVVAAGNEGRFGFPGSDGYWTITSPGNDPYVITVGAMRTMETPSRGDDLVASYSSKGPSLFDGVVKPDLVAPGNQVKAPLASPGCALAREFPAAITGSGKAQYIVLSGTSMATPVVSGTAALLLEKEPGLSPDQVKYRLMKTATKTFPATSVVMDSTTGKVYRSQYDVFTIGAGYLDILAALSEHSAPLGPALSPVANLDSQSGQVVVKLDPASVWTQAGGLSAAWGSAVFVPSSASAAWGSSAVWGSSVIWGSSAAWGSSAGWGTSAVWGSSVIWGNSAAWGSSAGWGSSLPPMTEN